MNVESFRKYSVLLMILVFCFGWMDSTAQTKSDLQKKRDELNKQIEYTKKLISEAKKNQKSASNDLLILNQQISLREQLLRNINREISQIDEGIADKANEIDVLEERIDKMKEEYGRMIYQAYKQRSAYDELMFIFAAQDFNQAFKRYKIVQNYSQVRKQQATEIGETQETLKGTIKQLEEQKLSKAQLAENKIIEKQKLDNDIKDQKETLTELQKKEKELKKQQQDQEAERQRVNAAIRKKIEEELADEKNKNNGKFELTPEGKLVSEKFEKNKGLLPWPVARGVIISRFGQQPHPTIPGIVIDNKGVDISTEANSNVRAIFGGTVTSVFSIQGAGQNIIITHGAYKTVYTNLKNVTLKKGDTVEARETLGQVISEDGKTIAHLEIWKVSQVGGTPQNPTSWIVKN